MSGFNNFFSVEHRRPGFNNRIRRLQQNNRRNSLFQDKGPHLFKQPGPPYPGPNPRAPNKPLDPTIIHPSNQYPIYKRPGKSPKYMCLYLVSHNYFTFSCLVHIFSFVTFNLE